MKPIVSPRLVVANVDDAVADDEKRLGAERGARHAGPSGHVVHAELTIGASLLSLTHSRGEWGLQSPETLGTSPLLLTLSVSRCEGRR